MTLWAVVPVKPLRRGKSRLSSVLSEDERAALNYSMLNNMLRTLKAVQEVQEVIVVSRDPSALSLAREFGARTVKEEGSPELNQALRRASKVAEAYSAQKLLILPADLPLITPEIICEFLSLSKEPPEIVIAPDRREDGTNALLINPCGLIDCSYGLNSFHRHIDKAKKKGAKINIFRNEAIELDLDFPEDLELLNKLDQSMLMK